MPSNRTSYPKQDCYETLGVDPSAEQEVIAAAFRALSKKYHPDGKDITDEAQKRINAAYDCLKNKESRRRYDAWREQQAPASRYPHTPPEPHASPATLDFGTLTRGSSRTLQLTVENRGGPVHEVEFALDDDESPFSVSVRNGDFPMILDVTLDTGRLPAGRCVEQLTVSLDGISLVVALRGLVRVPAAASPPRPSTSAATPPPMSPPSASSAGSWMALVLIAAIVMLIVVWTGIKRSASQPANVSQKPVAVGEMPRPWPGAIRLSKRTAVGGQLAISGRHELLYNGVPVTGPLLYAGRERPTRAYLSKLNETGRYAFISLGNEVWCDDHRLVDLQRSQIAQLPGDKHSTPGRTGASWAPDDAYALLTWSHGGESGFFLLDPTTLKIRDLIEPLNAQLGIRHVRVQRSPDVPRGLDLTVVPNLDSVRWTSLRTAEFTSNIVGTLWERDSERSEWAGRATVIGRMIGEMSVPDLIAALKQYWVAEDPKSAIESKVVSTFNVISGNALSAPVRFGEDGKRKEIFWVQPGQVPPVLEQFVRPTANELPDWRGIIVIADMVIDAHGIPGSISVLSGGGREGRQIISNAIEKSRFRPGTQDGKPTAVPTTIEFTHGAGME